MRHKIPVYRKRRHISFCRVQYELACRLLRMEDSRRVDSTTAQTLLHRIDPGIIRKAAQSTPAPVWTWRSGERWLRFVELRHRYRVRQRQAQRESLAARLHHPDRQPLFLEEKVS